MERTEAVVQESAPAEIEIPSGAAYSEWRKTGALPDETTKEVTPSTDSASKAASAPATEVPAEKEASPASPPETAADSAAAPSQERKAKKQSDDRFNKLFEAWQRDKDELDRLKKGPATADKQESRPAAEVKSAKPKIDDKNEKGEYKFKTIDEFNDAKDEWLRQDTLREFEEKTAKSAKETQAQQAERVVNEKFAERIVKAREKHSDYDAVALQPDLQVKKGSPVDYYLVDSEHGAEVLYELGKNPAELERINKLNPVAQVRELARIEFRIAGDIPAPAKRISNAPPPPKEVGGKGTAPGDEVESAVKEEDFDAYRSAQNRRDMARRKGK